MPDAQTAPAARPNPPASRGRAAIAAFAAIAVLPGAALGLGLGEITQQSALGRPLRVVVPVIAGPGEELSGECFKLAATPRPGDGIPEVLTGRVALERVGATARLVISSQRQLDDPIVRLTVQAGCENPVRREYTLLLDPPPIETPVVAAEAPARLPESLPASAPVAAGSEAPARAPVGAAGPPARERPSSPTTSSRSSTARTEARPPRAAPSPRPARRPAPPSVEAAPTPKLTVSTAVPAAGGAAKPASNAALARQQQELADALEAETIVLRQRVAELTATVDRMQKDIEAAQALQAARLAADEAAKRTPEATIARWWADGWPILAGIFGLAVLIAAVLAWRRRRPADEHHEWMHAAAATEPPAQPVPDARTAPPPRPGPDPSGKPTAVAVSELTHVTEEAGVYLAFNRVDRAIEVLEQHIRNAPASLPAAWLMLLELYRRQGRETDFRNVGSEFHRRFNAQTPDWESYPPPSDADGVEAFPHVVAQLASSWGTAECRAYLDRLLRDNREGRRTGFSLGAYEDLVFLRQLSEIVHAEPPGARGGARLPRPPAQAAAAAGPATAAKRPPTLDLELELDRDMLDTMRPTPPSDSSGRS